MNLEYEKGITNNLDIHKSIQTKKNKEKVFSRSEIKNMWKLFDDNNDNMNNDITDNITPECIYRKESNNIINNDICVSCKSHLFIGEDGLMICPNKKCSLIYKDNLDNSAEWRFYGPDDNNLADPTRCGMPINPLLQESSYSCKVLCHGKQSYEMHKIRRYTDWVSMPYKEKSHYDEFQLIITMSKNAGIPKLIIDDAMRYHKQISEKKTYRGSNRDGIIAASIYISCKVNNYPRTPKEIASIFNLNNSSATKACKNAIFIINEIQHNNREMFQDNNDNDNDNNNDINSNNKISLNSTTPLTFIQRYCSKLNINMELTKLCEFIAYKIIKNDLIPENTPHSIAGGIIYYISQICSLNISKLDITNISKISEVTINKCYKKIEQISDKLIPEMIIKKYKI
jgi:transcription initiation factor TFIIB